MTIFTQLSHHIRFSMAIASIAYFSLFFGDLECKGDESADNCSLIVACKQRNVDEVVRLLRAGANVNSRYGNCFEIKSLEKQRTERILGDWTPLIALLHSSQPEDGNSNDMSIKQRLLENRQVEILRILISHKCDLELKDSRGATALWYAIANRHIRESVMLIQYGAEVNFQVNAQLDGPGGRSPLHAAYWSEELTQLLLREGADENVKDDEGTTPAELRAQVERSHRPFVENDPFGK